MVVVNTKLERPDDVHTCCGRRDVTQSPEPDLLIGQLQRRLGAAAIASDRLRPLLSGIETAELHH